MPGAGGCEVAGLAGVFREREIPSRAAKVPSDEVIMSMIHRRPGSHHFNESASL